MSERHNCAMSLREAAQALIADYDSIEPEEGSYKVAWPQMEALRDALAEASKHDALKDACELAAELDRRREERNKRLGLDEAEKAEPVAWMHNQRVDCIHNEVKELLQRAGGHLHRPLDKTENYTIPLYTHPPAALPESVELSDDDIEAIWFATVKDVPRDSTNRQIRVACIRAVLAAARGKG